MHGLELPIAAQATHLLTVSVYCAPAVPVASVAAEIDYKAVFLAFLAIRATKQMVEFPFNQHEGGSTFHAQRKIAWLGELFKIF